MSLQDLHTVHETRRSRALSGNRTYTTVEFPKDLYRKVKARARNDGVSVREETLRLCSLALKTDDPGFSPPLAAQAQEIVEALAREAAGLGGDRRIPAVGSMLEAARLIRKLSAQVRRLGG